MMNRLFAIILAFCLIISWVIFSPTYAEPPETLIQLAQTGTLRITSTTTVKLQHTGRQLIISGPGLVSTLDCRVVDCSTPDSIQIPASPVKKVELVVGRDKLTFDIIQVHQFDLSIARSADNRAINLNWAGDVRLASADVAGKLSINHEGNEGDALTTTGYLAAEDIDIVGGNIIINGSITASRDVNLLAGDTLQIRDSKRQPARIEVGGRLTLQADQIDIFALAHPDSTLISGGDMVLRSQNTVRGDAHYLSGGQVSFERLDGQPADLFSPYDPIILASGDVSIANYTGASLHILAGGSVTLNNVTITGTDVAANTINPGNGTLFNGGATLGSLANFNLSNGTAVSIDGSATPTLDVRAGIDWAGNAPTDQVIGGGVSPIFSGATGAEITVTGVISMAQPSGVVLLTNQYRPNNLAGNISTGDIEANTTLPSTNGGSIIIDTRGDMTTGALDTSAEATGNGVTAGNGGPITLLAPNGGINTGGNVTSFARIPGNNSGTVGNGGSIFIAAANDVSINNGIGGIDSFAFANSNGNAGDGGDITVSAGSFSAARLYAQSFAGTNGTAGNGGTVSINATNGAVNIDSGGFAFASIQTFGQDFNTTAGDAGAVTIAATSGISISHGIDARANGTNSQGGDISLTTTNGNISAAFLRAFASNNTTPGNAGNVTAQALNGGITTGDVDAYSNAFFINNPSQNGGNVSLQALNGDVVTGQITTYSEARGLLGDSGNGGTIDINAVNGGITANGNLQSYARSSINNSNSSDAGFGGNITLQATGNISVTGNIESYSLSDIFGNTPVAATSSDAGNISVTSTNGSVSTGNLSSYSSAQSLTGNGGNITISAITGINLNNGNGILSSYTSAFTDTADAGNAGNVTITTNSGDLFLKQIVSQATAQFGNNAGNGGDITLNTGNGSIDISGNFFNALNSRVGAGNVAGDAGDITLTATQGINIVGTITADVDGIDGNAGIITLITTNGNITISDRVDASAVYGSVGSVGNGGNVLVQALNGSTLLNDVWTFSLAFLIHNDTRNGGNITVQALNGDATFGDLLAYSEARGAQGDTGAAGQIEVTATNGGISGNLVRADARSAINNNGSGIVGNGNDVTMQATNDINLSDGILTASAAINTSTGQASPVGSSNNAGQVTLSANNIAFSYIDARSVSPTTIGNGGTVQILANQFVQSTGNVFGNAETISAIGSPGTGAIGITHGGAGVTPFIVGDASTNGVSGALTTADASISPLNSYLTSHFEAPNIGIISVAPPPIITKTASPTIDAPYHGEIVYTVVISNEALIDANGVFLTDTLPAEVDFNRWNQQNGATVINDEITWNGTVPANDALTFEFVVDHAGNYSDVFTNTASFSHADTISSGTASVAVAVEAPPVLSIIKTAAPNTNVTYQGEISYTIVLSNSSNTIANNTLLTDTLPTEVNFSRWTQQNGATVLNDEITWNGTVPANDALTFEFVVDHIGNYSDNFANVANFSHPASGSSSIALAFVTVEESPLLSISKTAFPNTNVTNRGEVTYTVVLSNSSDTAATNTTFTDTLPAQVNFNRWNQQNGATVINDEITWNGTVPANGSITFEFVVDHVGNFGDTVLNTAEYSHDSSSGSAAATFTIEPALANTTSTFLPLIMKNGGLPDLIVDSIIADSNAVTVTIKNIGSGPVVDAFWVDVYIDPDTPPTTVNQRWHDVGSQGLVWGVVAPALPIAANGGTLTLTLNDAYYFPNRSTFNPPLAVGTPVYAQVDSVNLLTNYGGVLESHEVNGEDYNNIAGTSSVLGLGEAVLSTGGASSIPEAVLPQRE